MENKCGDKILFIDEPFPIEKHALLLNTCDAFVSLHRSEGFGRLLAEAMTLGKLLIASDFGGNTDFTTPETACPVNGRLVEVKPREYLLGAGQQWFEADIDHAAQYMRDFVENPSRFAVLAENGRRHIMTHHSLEAVGHRAKEALMKAGVIS
jgi:glycosyltransferase involved in cell wall biosynthesis